MKTKKSGIYLDEKTKKYYVSTTFKTKDNFTIKKCKRGFDTLKNAELWKLKTKDELSKKTYANLTACKSGIELAIDNYIKYKSNNTKAKTLSRMDSVLKKLFKDYINNNYNLDDFQVKDLNNIYSALCSMELTAPSKNQYISDTLNFLEYLDLMELVDISIYRKAKLIFQRFEVKEASNKQIFENDEYESFIQTFNNDDWYKLAFELLFYTGARISEVLALTWNDIDLVNNEISFNKHALYGVNKYVKDKDELTKNKSAVIAPGTKTQNKVVSIFGDLINELEYFKKLTDDEFLFFNKFVESTISKVLTKHLKLAGIDKNITLHSFRHTHTTMLYDLGLDGKYIAERLGHSNENTSKIVYEHITESRKKHNDEILKNKFVI